MTGERVYSGRSLGEVTVREDGTTRPLDPRTDLTKTEPRPFTWGANPSGAAQLSLALLADALGDDEAAKKYHQKFLDRVITNLPNRWTITRTRILAYVELIKYDNRRVRA